jgi:hypothetical protein
VVFGELHGTRETPALVGEYVCSISATRPGVVVALEIPDSEQPRIDSYLSSEGNAGDRTNLLSGGFWTRPGGSQDGRSSEAAVALIERLRQLRKLGRKVIVVAMDGSRPDMTRDAVMAQNVERAARNNPGFAAVVLTGNVHAIRRRGVFVSDSYEPLAYLIAPDGAMSLEVISAGGTAWVCIDGCGPRKIQPDPLAHGKEAGVYIGVARDGWYDGSVLVPELTASPPAIRP